MCSTSLFNPTLSPPIRAARCSPPAQATPPATTTRKPWCRDTASADQAITFAPLAWPKLLTLLHADDVEVGGFGISADGDLLHVTDVAVPLQHVSPVTVRFDDTSVAEHFETYADNGFSPFRCGRIWIHTHPGSSATPSLVDEETFDRAFGGSDWAAMVIVARGGQTYCRLRFSAGPGGQVVVPVRVDWADLPQALLDHEGQLDALTASWLDEYGRNVHPVVHDRLGAAFDLFDGETELDSALSPWPDGPVGSRDDPFPSLQDPREDDDQALDPDVYPDADEEFLRYFEERLDDGMFRSTREPMEVPA